MPTKSQLPPIALEAVQWKLRANQEGPACHSELNAWLRESTEHFEAYLCVLFMWNQMGRIDPERKIDVDEMVRPFRNAQTS
jgi:ferric-dicitrate binding protein FerR (iron transport regulator)